MDWIGTMANVAFESDMSGIAFNKLRQSWGHTLEKISRRVGFTQCKKSGHQYR